MNLIKRMILEGLNKRGWELRKMGLEPGITYDQDGLRTIHNADFLSDARFVAAYQRGLKASDKDYKNHWRVQVALWAGETASRLPGDFVECGVNKGFVSSAMMFDLGWNSLGKTFWLLDTFEGIDERFISDEERAAGIMERNVGDFYVKGVDSVRANFTEWNGVEIVVGAVPETLAAVTSEQIAYLHLDMNCAPPEVAALEYFWPKMVPGGLVLMDDYTYFGYEPQHIALRDCAKVLGTSILGLPTGQGLMIKPAAK